MTIDFAALKAKLSQTKASLKKAGTTIKPKQGKNQYVILPPYKDADWFHTFGQHYIKDATDKLAAVYVCADRTHGDNCPICNAMSEAQRTIGVANPEVAETIKKAYARQEFLVGVLALDSDTPNEPQVLNLGKKAFEQLVTLVESWAEQVFDPTNPQIVVIERSGTGVNDTTYTVQPSPSRHAFKKAVKPIDLDEFVKMESEAAEKKALLALSNLASGAAALPAPTSKDRPSTPPAPPTFDDVPDSFVPSGAATPAPSTAAPAGPGISDDIDALLGDLESA